MTDKSRWKHNKSIVPLARELRKAMTDEERHLWYDFLRTYPVRFQRQKVIENYIVDFYCAKAKLAIELDGSYHRDDEVAKNDEIRTSVLEKYGIHVFRIPNKDIHKKFPEVCKYIDSLVDYLICNKE